MSTRSAATARNSAAAALATRNAAAKVREDFLAKMAAGKALAAQRRNARVTVTPASPAPATTASASPATASPSGKKFRCNACGKPFRTANGLAEFHLAAGPCKRPAWVAKVASASPAKVTRVKGRRANKPATPRVTPATVAPASPAKLSADEKLVLVAQTLAALVAALA